MMSEVDDASWEAVAAALEQDGSQNATSVNGVVGHAGLVRTYPSNEMLPKSSLSVPLAIERDRFSLLEGMQLQDVAADRDHAERGRALHVSLSGLLKQLRVFESMSRCPILAITGILNSGKSTLLASYLSPENRRRVLRGLGNDAGTHRFVLWLPKTWWDDAELLNTLISFLSSLFGHPPEHLSSDPDKAALQYNGQVIASSIMHSPASDSQPEVSSKNKSTSPVDGLDVPLIAYDENLNDLRLGLIDCPDIQTGFLSSAPATLEESDLVHSRRRQLEKVGRLCSAFVVLCKMNSLHDEGLLDVLTTLRDSMPGVPRLLAVNKVKARYSPQVVYEQSRTLVDRFGIRSVFAAYDFRSAFADERVPPKPRRMQLDDGEKMPIFFEARNSEGTESTSQSEVAAHANHQDGTRMIAAQQQVDYLFDLGERLDAGTLSRESSRSLRLQLKTKAAQVVDWYETNQKRIGVRESDAWQSLADACYEFMAERDAEGNAVGLRLQASPAIVQQMADSLQRTAPSWMRISLSIDKSVRQLHTAIANSTSRFRMLESASESVKRFTKRFRRGEGAQVVTPERLTKAIRGTDLHEAFSRVDESHLRAGCELAMQRFAEEDQSKLNDQELDEWSRQVWEGMSWKDKLWKGTQPLAVLTAPLLAAILVPIDGGGSAVLVFASVKELLAAAGIAAVMAPMATGGEALGIVHRETPWRQLSDLFALLCDGVGVQRPENARLPQTYCQGSKRTLLPCSLDVKPPANQAALYGWRVEKDVVQSLQLAIKKL